MELSLALLALLLGFKHSLDADHLLAVGAMMRRVRTVPSAIKGGVCWALGHMVTAAALTVFLYFFADSFLSSVLPYFEKVAGLMIIVFGLFGLRDFFFPVPYHAHASPDTIHRHEGSHVHRTLFGIGIIHGLASNDELLSLLLITIGVSSLLGLVAGIAFFSIGIVIGMVLFSAFFSVLWQKSRGHFYNYFTLGLGFLSIAYGLVLLA